MSNTTPLSSLSYELRARRAGAVCVGARAAILVMIGMAGSACGAATNPAVTAQITKLQSGEETSSRDAISALSAMGSDAIDATPALIPIARGEGPDYLRYEALSALGEIGANTSEALEVLLKALDPKGDMWVASAAARSLGKVGHGRNEIETRLREVAVGHGEPIVRQAALEALGTMGAREAESAVVLLNALKHDSDIGVKRSAARGLWLLPRHAPEIFEGVKVSFSTVSESWIKASRNIFFPSPEERSAVFALENLQEELLLAIALMASEPGDTERFLGEIPASYMSDSARRISAMLVDDLKNESPFASGIRAGLGERFERPTPPQQIGVALNNYIAASLSKDGVRLREAASELARAPRTVATSSAAQVVILERQNHHLRAWVTKQSTTLEDPSAQYLLGKVLDAGSVILYTNVEGILYAMGPEGSIFSHRAIEEAINPYVAWDERPYLGFPLVEVPWQVREAPDNTRVPQY